jgi:hypothetical protein
MSHEEHTPSLEALDRLLAARGKEAEALKEHGVTPEALESFTAFRRLITARTLEALVKGAKE